MPPGLTAKGVAQALLLYNNCVALSSLFQAPAGESGTGSSRRENSAGNQQVRLLPGRAAWGEAGRQPCVQGRRVEDVESDFHP